MSRSSTASPADLFRPLSRRVVVLWCAGVLAGLALTRFGGDALRGWLVAMSWISLGVNLFLLGSPACFLSFCQLLARTSWVPAFLILVLLYGGALVVPASLLAFLLCLTPFGALVFAFQALVPCLLLRLLPWKQQARRILSLWALASAACGAAGAMSFVYPAHPLAESRDEVLLFVLPPRTPIPPIGDGYTTWFLCHEAEEHAVLARLGKRSPLDASSHDYSASVDVVARVPRRIAAPPPTQWLVPESLSMRFAQPPIFSAPIRSLPAILACAMLVTGCRSYDPLPVDPGSELTTLAFRRVTRF